MYLSKTVLQEENCYEVWGTLLQYITRRVILKDYFRTMPVMIAMDNQRSMMRLLRNLLRTKQKGNRAYKTTRA
jgi:predicted class III extradiol MEMO1 family dioxygenase